MGLQMIWWTIWFSTNGIARKCPAQVMDYVTRVSITLLIERTSVASSGARCSKESFTFFDGSLLVNLFAFWYPPEVQHSPWKMVVGRLLSDWEGNFSGAMLNIVKLWEGSGVCGAKALTANLVLTFQRFVSWARLYADGESLAMKFHRGF